MCTYNPWVMASRSLNINRFGGAGGEGGDMLRTLLQCWYVASNSRECFSGGGEINTGDRLIGWLIFAL